MAFLDIFEYINNWVFNLCANGARNWADLKKMT